jgi:hypothetical protein
MTQINDQINNTLSQYRGRISACFAADPRKAWVLTILTLILMVLAGRLMFKGHGLAAALAAHSDSSLAAGDDHWQPASSSPSLPLAAWARKPILPIGRNLFSIPLDYFPYADGVHPLSSDSNGGDGLWDQMARSRAAQADSKREHQILVDNLRTQAATLKLQGTVLGDDPKAWVNGALVGVGGQIETSGFRIVRIEARRIVVEREDVRLAIEMK